MKKIIMLMAVTGLTAVLSGCVIAPPNEHHHRHHNDNNTVTRDGITLPDCATLPDASQADNGSRCWFR